MNLVSKHDANHSHAERSSIVAAFAQIPGGSVMRFAADTFEGLHANWDATQFRTLDRVDSEIDRFRHRIDAAAARRDNCLVIAEPSEGREMIARAIHERGPDAAGTFIKVDCAALPEDLLEGEIFGSSQYLGCLHAADRGTLFIDDVTEMETETQKKLARAIRDSQTLNIRLIIAMSWEARAALEAGVLRDDLYRLVRGSIVRMPNVREGEEIASAAEDSILI
jgi:DNA-binding NtrC family response regulator